MSELDSLFLAVTGRSYAPSDASLQRLSNELLSPSTALYVVRAPWCNAFLTALTDVLNSHSSTSKSKLHALCCLSLLANRITLPLLAVNGGGGEVPNNNNSSISVSEVITFRRELLLPAVLDLQEATEEWLVDKEEASRQLGTSLGRQHEQILTLLLRATNTDCQWAMTCGSGENQQPLLDFPAADRAKVQGSFLSLYTILHEFCHGRVSFLLGLLLGIAKVQSVDMLMLETVTRLLCDLSIPTSYFDPEMTSTSSSEVDIGVFQGRVNDLQSSCLSLNIVETIVSRLADRVPIGTGGDGAQKNIGEKIVWGQAVTNITKFVLNVLEFSTTSKTIQNQWIQTVLPLPSGAKRASSAVSVAVPPGTSLVTTLVPLLLTHATNNTATTTTTAPSQTNQVYWALKLIASVFFDPIGTQSSATTSRLHSAESMTDFDVPYFCSGQQQQGTNNSVVSSPLYSAVHDILSGGVSEYVVAQVKLFATASSPQAPTQPQLRRLLLTTLRAFINVNHSGDNAKTLVNRVVSEAHRSSSCGAEDTHGALRQVIAEVYGDLMAAMEDLSTNSEAYFDIVQVHIWNLLTGSTRKVTSDSMAASLNGDSSGCFGDVQYDVPNPLAMTDEEIDTITMQIDQDIHTMERDISDLGSMMQDVRSSTSNVDLSVVQRNGGEGAPAPTTTTTTTANLSSLEGAPQLTTPSRAKKHINNNTDTDVVVVQNSSNLRRAKRQDASVPKELCCMWTGNLMREPIKVPAGGESGGVYHWFDLAALEAVCKEVGSVNPLTGESLPDAIADGISAGGDAIVDLNLQKKITKYKMSRAKTLNNN